MTTAELQANPTEELSEFVAVAKEHSAASESTVRKDFPCDDAILVVTSHAGGDVGYWLEPLPPVEVTRPVEAE